MSASRPTSSRSCKGAFRALSPGESRSRCARAARALQTRAASVLCARIGARRSNRWRRDTAAAPSRRPQRAALLDGRRGERSASLLSAFAAMLSVGANRTAERAALGLRGARLRRRRPGVDWWSALGRAPRARGRANSRRSGCAHDGRRPEHAQREEISVAYLCVCTQTVLKSHSPLSLSCARACMCCGKRQLVTVQSERIAPRPERCTHAHPATRAPDPRAGAGGGSLRAGRGGACTYDSRTEMCLLRLRADANARRTIGRGTLDRAVGTV